MVIIAVIVGYILGVAPFLVPFIYNKIIENKSNIEVKDEKNEINAILNEYINGKEYSDKIEGEGITTEDIFKEYTTGVPTSKGGM